MATEAKLSHTAAMILQAINAGYIYGFSVMEMTGLPSGTVYPAMRRLERDGLIKGEWRATENNRRAKYYGLTAAGRKKLNAETRAWEAQTAAIARILAGEA